MGILIKGQHARYRIGEGGGGKHLEPIAQTLIKLPGLPKDQLRIALTRTFKAPDIVNLIPRRRRYEINSANNADLEGNPLLRPELAQGVDVTYEHRFGKSGLLSAGVSRRLIDDYTLTGASLVFRQGGWATVTAAQSVRTADRSDVDVYLLWKRNASDQIRFTVGNLLGQDEVSASRFVTSQSTLTRTITAPGKISVRVLVEHKF